MQEAKRGCGEREHAHQISRDGARYSLFHSLHKQTMEASVLRHVCAWTLTDLNPRNSGGNKRNEFHFAAGI